MRDLTECGLSEGYSNRNPYLISPFHLITNITDLQRQVLIQLIDPTSPINQELKAKAGPSTGHSQLVQGLSKLLKDGPGGAAFEESLREDADSSGMRGR